MLVGFICKVARGWVAREKNIVTLYLPMSRGSSVVRHLPLVLEVPGSIPARGEKNFGVRTRFP